MRYRNSLLKGAFAALVMCMGFGGMTAKGAEPGCIYYVNWNLTSDGAPVVANESTFTKLYETAAGSNIYTGNVQFTDGYNWFRFYSKLQESYDSPDFSWFKYNVCPMIDGYAMPQIGESGVYLASNVHHAAMIPPGTEPGTWLMNDEGIFQATVDLNKGTLELIPCNGLLAIINDATEPDLSHLENYTAIQNLAEYVPAGKFDVYLYSVLKKGWVTSADNDLMSGRNSIASNNLTDSPGAPRPFSVKGKWPGGAILGSRSWNFQGFYLDLNADGMVLGQYSFPQVYLVGDMTYWSFDDTFKFNAANPEGTKFNVTIPAGTEMFKITPEKKWDLNFGVGEITKNSKGEFVISLVTDGANITFTSALTDELTGVVDLDELTVTLPASAPLMVTSPGEETAFDGLYVSLPTDKFELWAGAPNSIRSQFQTLPRTGENEWSGKVSVFGGQFNLRFISELTDKGQPNKVIAPSTGKDRQMVYVDGYAYSSAVLMPENEAGYWTDPYWPGGTADVTVTLENGKYVLKIDCPQLYTGNEIYLIGQPQGWDINSNAMRLFLTDRGGYYGNFNISSNEAMFRFYTVLGDWENNSIGAQYEDIPLEFSINNGTLTTDYVYGKGSFSLTDWKGGTMYIYVDINNGNVTFSDGPIAGAGNVISTQGRQPVKEGVFVGRSPMIEESKGVYSFNTGSQYRSEDMEFHLFSRLLPISDDEPESVGSYTIAPSGDGVADVSKGVQTFDIVRNDQLGTTPATPLTVTGLYKRNSNVSILVDLNEGKLYVADLGGYFILPSGTQAPTVKNLEKFEDRRISTSGGIVEIPAGEFNVWYSMNGGNAEPSVTKTISFDNDPMAIFEDAMSNWGWIESKVSNPGWKGGKVYFNSMIIYDLSQLKKIKAYADTTEFVLNETAPSSLVYKGEIEFGRISQSEYMTVHGLSFTLDSREVVRNLYGQDQTIWYTISLGCPYAYNGWGGYTVTREDRSLVVKSGQASSAMSFGGAPFVFPNVTAGKFEVTLDLNTMTVDLKQVEGTSSGIYETVAEDAGVLDGAVSYVSGAKDNAAIIEAPEVTGSSESYEFNLASDGGEVLVPESGQDMEVTFDNFGVWTGKYRKVSVAEATSISNAQARRAAARRAAPANAKWNFNVPDGEMTNLSILIDESAGTITIFSMAHNRAFFVYDGESGLIPTVVALDKARNNSIVPVEEGIFKGTFELTESVNGSNYVAFIKDVVGYYGNIGRGLAGNNSNYNGLDLTTADHATDYAWELDATFWEIKAKPGKYVAIYDANENLLTVYTDEASVDELVVDGTEKPVIIPGIGNVTVIAGMKTTVNIYSLNGVLVKSLNVEEGKTTVDIPAGFYIAGGRKIVVR